MPIYEFICPTCVKDFEVLCSMDTTGKEVPCPSCGNQNTTRKLSPFKLAVTQTNTEALPNFNSSSQPSGGCCGPSGCGCHS